LSEVGDKRIEDADIIKFNHLIRLLSRKSIDAKSSQKRHGYCVL